jgi:hypothetical protein
MRQLVPLKQVPQHRTEWSERRLRKLVAERRVGFYKEGSRVLLDLEELDRHVQTGRVEPTR